MNKKQFLNELEKRLKVLNENERKDIINEYSDIINEKIKNGKTEEQAVLEFGDIDSLVKEILESYKINPDYDNNFSKKAKDVANNAEDLIKKGAKKLADTTTNIVNDFKNSDSNITLETIFEIIIKVFIFLIILAILRIPFYLLRGLGGSILDPFDLGFNIVWNIIIWLVYIICCVLIGIIFFKKNFREYKDSGSNSKSKNNTKKNLNEEKETRFNTYTSYNEDSTNNEQKKSSGVLLILLKIFAIIFIMFPICTVVIGLFIAAGFSLYLLIKGVPILGIFIALLGLSIGSSWLFDVFNRLIFARKKINIWPFFVSLVVFITGGIIFATSLFEFNFYDKVPNVKLDNYTETIHINDYLRVRDMYESEIIIDDNLSDDEVVVSVDYYDKLTKIEKYNNSSTNELALKIHLYKKSKFNFKEIFNDIISDLKKYNVYNYNYLFKGRVTIKVNKNTKDKIIILK